MHTDPPLSTSHPRVCYNRWCCTDRHIFIPQSPWFARRFTLAVHPVSFGKCVMTCIHHDSIMQSSLITLKSFVPHLFIPPFHPLLGRNFRRIPGGKIMGSFQKKQNLGHSRKWSEPVMLWTKCPIEEITGVSEGLTEVTQQVSQKMFEFPGIFLCQSVYSFHALHPALLGFYSLLWLLVYWAICNRWHLTYKKWQLTMAFPMVHSRGHSEKPQCMLKVGGISSVSYVL